MKLAYLVWRFRRSLFLVAVVAVVVGLTMHLQPKPVAYCPFDPNPVYVYMGPLKAKVQSPLSKLLGEGLILIPSRGNTPADRLINGIVMAGFVADRAAQTCVELPGTPVFEVQPHSTIIPTLTAPMPEVTEQPTLVGPVPEAVFTFVGERYYPSDGQGWIKDTAFTGLVIDKDDYMAVDVPAGDQKQETYGMPETMYMSLWDTNSIFVETTEGYMIQLMAEPMAAETAIPLTPTAISSAPESIDVGEWMGLEIDLRPLDQLWRRIVDFANCPDCKG